MEEERLEVLQREEIKDYCLEVQKKVSSCQLRRTVPRAVKAKTCNLKLMLYLLRLKTAIVFRSYFLIYALMVGLLFYTAWHNSHKRHFQRISFKLQPVQEGIIFVLEGILAKTEFRLKRATLSHIASSFLLYFFLIMVPGLAVLSVWEWSLSKIPLFLAVYSLIAFHSTLLS